MRKKAFTVAIVLLVLVAGPLAAPRTGVVDPSPPDTAQDRYRIYHPAGSPRRLLVLLPGYGRDVDSFDPSSGSTPSTLPSRLASHGVATIVAVPVAATLYVDDSRFGSSTISLQRFFDDTVSRRNAW
jgi:hypothetical protein